jgi:hypothetical protein
MGYRQEVGLWLLAACVAGAAAHVSLNLSPDDPLPLLTTHEVNSDGSFGADKAPEFGDILLCQEKARQMEEGALREQHKAGGCRVSLQRTSFKLLSAKHRASEATEASVNATRDHQQSLASAKSAVKRADMHKSAREAEATNCSSQILVLEAAADALKKQAEFQDEEHSSELSSVEQKIALKTGEAKLQIQIDARRAKEDQVASLRNETMQMVLRIRHESAAQITKLKASKEKVLSADSAQHEGEEGKAQSAALVSEHDAEAERLRSVERAQEERDAALSSMPALEDELASLKDNIRKQNDLAAAAAATHSKLKEWAHHQLTDAEEFEVVSPLK